MSIIWKIEQMIVKPVDGAHNDVVITASWRCTAEQDGKTASNYGSSGFAAPGDTFVAYDDLTEQTVLDWCYANGVDKAQVEDNVQRELEALLNPPVVAKPLPW